MKSSCFQRSFVFKAIRTWGKRLLELLGLVAVLDDKGVEVALAADLELDLLRRGLLDVGRFRNNFISIPVSHCFLDWHGKKTNRKRPCGGRSL